MSAPQFTPLPLFGGADIRAPAPPAWAPLPMAGVPRFDAAMVLAQWPRLHAGQPLPPPSDPALADAWALYHSGDFAAAAAAGLALGDDGASLADQATAIYANYVEPREATRLALFRQVGDRAHARAIAHPEDCQALYWHAYALGRYAQAVSVARALAQGLGGKLKQTLERIIELQPTHADAHFALGAFHAEVIDKVGPLVGRMTYGVRADTAVALFERGLEVNPHSAAGLMEYARALLALEDEAKLAHATRLFEQAAAIEPLDARELLDVELARAGLQE